MYLFSRSTIATLGREFDAIPAAIEVAAMVTRITGRDVNVYTAHFGAPQGSVMWGARADSLVDLQETTDKLMVDAEYLEKLESMNGLFMAPAEDRFSRFITPPMEATSKYYGITRAAMANGKFADAMAFGVEDSRVHRLVVEVPVGIHQVGVRRIRRRHLDRRIRHHGRRRRLRRLADDRRRLPRHRESGGRALRGEHRAHELDRKAHLTLHVEGNAAVTIGV